MHTVYTTSVGSSRDSRFALWVRKLRLLKTDIYQRSTWLHQVQKQEMLRVYGMHAAPTFSNFAAITEWIVLTLPLRLKPC